VRQERDDDRFRRSIEALQDGARGDVNIIPLLLEAVRAYASVGEISMALIPVFGAYRETSVF
jgi:methylmalonyl-CoA mutase N-terminal domain/subunit